MLGEKLFNVVLVLLKVILGLQLLDEEGRLQNSPYFCVFKYARAVKQKVWNEAENRERDWGFFTDFEKKNDCFAVYEEGHMMLLDQTRLVF